VTSPSATRPNLLLMLRDHLEAEIAATEAEIAQMERKINEQRDHLHTLRDVRAAAKLDTATEITPTLQLEKTG